jgi:glycosyltransferase involved in cell wall biosynthesis
MVEQRPHTISVVIPAFNCELYVGEAIESVLAQTLPAHEIIVIDDGSTDGTMNVLRGFGARLRVIAQQNQGPSVARNRGAALATGAWLAFLDADDSWLPWKLQRQMEVAAEQDVAMVYTDRLNIGARGALPEIHGDIQELYSGDVFVDLLLRGNHMSLSSVVIGTDLFKALGGFAEHMRASEDWDLWIRAAEHNRIGVVAEPLIRYRFHATMSSGAPRRMRDGRNAVVKRALESGRGRTLSASVRRRILTSVALTNALDASKKRDRVLALEEFARAAQTMPWSLPIYADFLRFLLGRHA